MGCLKYHNAFRLLNWLDWVISQICEMVKVSSWLPLINGELTSSPVIKRTPTKSAQVSELQPHFLGAGLQNVSMHVRVTQTAQEHLNSLLINEKVHFEVLNKELITSLLTFFISWSALVWTFAQRTQPVPKPLVSNTEKVLHSNKPE